MTDQGAEFAGRLAADAARLLASSLGEFVPQEAQVHLLAAQRELLLALAVILEHNQSRFSRSDSGDEPGDDEPTPRPRTRRGAKRRSAPRRPQRVELE